MSAIRKRNIAKLETNYTIKQEESQMSAVRRKKLLFRRLTAFFICSAAISFVMISTLVSQSSALEDKIAKKKILEKEYASLKKQEIILKEEIVKLNDEEYLAKLARKDYFLSEKGEIIFNIPKEKDN